VSMGVINATILGGYHMVVRTRSTHWSTHHTMHRSATQLGHLLQCTTSCTSAPVYDEVSRVQVGQ